MNGNLGWMYGLCKYLILYNKPMEFMAFRYWNEKGILEVFWMICQVCMNVEFGNWTYGNEECSHVIKMLMEKT